MKLPAGNYLKNIWNKLRFGRKNLAINEDMMFYLDQIDYKMRRHGL